MTRSFRPLLVLFAVMALIAAACGSDAEVASDAPADAPTVVVSTNILGDVVQNLVGSEMNVVTIMPVGADPHDFQASAQQVAAIGESQAMVVNGESFEEGLLDVIEQAEADGIPVYEAMSTVSAIEFGEDGHDDHDDHEDEEHEDHEDEEHEDEEHDDHAGHDHSGDDPHFFTDPARMAVAADGIADYLIATVEGIDGDALRASADAYIAELNTLDGEVVEILAELTEEQRVLVTNHEVFGYFADRYDFEVVGAVIPSGSTADGASAQALAELAEIVEAEGVAAIFSDTSSSDELAQTLADEVGDIAVVELFSESLGDADSEGSTYLDMVRTNANRIASALGA